MLLLASKVLLIFSLVRQLVAKLSINTRNARNASSFSEICYKLGITSDEIERRKEIFTHLPARDFKPIVNKYGIKQSCNFSECGDFHIVGYFIDDYRFAAIVRRLDALRWDFDVSIFVHEVTNSTTSDQNGRLERIETFNIGKSERYWKCVLFDTKVSIRPIEYEENQSIPRQIIQTFHSNKSQNYYHWNAYRSFVELNPEYIMKMFDDNESRKFIRSHFDNKVIEAYDVLVSRTFKADIFRYAYLYVHGGCYFDHKMINRLPLREVISRNDSLLVCSDAMSTTGYPPNTLADTKALYNAVICSKPGDKRLLQTINFIVDNIARRKHGGSDLALTGPVAFFKAISNDLLEEEVRFKHGFSLKALTLTPRTYEDYYVKEKLSNKIFLTKHYKGFAWSPQKRYGIQWLANIIYYEKLFSFQQWKVYTFATNRDCIKTELKSDGSLAIKVSQSNSFYEKGNLQFNDNSCLNMRLTIINDITSEEHKFNLPMESSYTLIFEDGKIQLR